MIVRNWKKIFKTGIDPATLCDPLAFGAMTVATRIVAKVQVATVITNIDMVTEMTAATVLDVEHDRLLFSRQLVGCTIRAAIAPENVGYLKLGPLGTRTARFNFGNRGVHLGPLRFSH